MTTVEQLENRMPDPEEINQLLPYLLRLENEARYQEGDVLIADRRKYPFEKTFYRCQTVEEVAQAIEKMVTQGGGPWVAAPFALASAARDAQGMGEKAFRRHLESARERLISTRPTNTGMALILEKTFQAAVDACQEGASAEQAVLDEVRKDREAGLRSAWLRGMLGAGLIEDGDGIITMCFAETAFLLALALADREGKALQVYVPETRPYLQGARLTAPSIQEIGVPVTLITDNMPAHLIAQGKIDKFFTAADSITLDGHVVNKIGTYQIALAAHAHSIPYFPFLWGIDPGRTDRESVEIEERDPEEIRHCRSQRTTREDIPAYYPAFDITPPHLVAGIITQKGVFSPYDLYRHYRSPGK